MPPVFKCVELSVVSDDHLEVTVNQWVALGWTFDRVDYVTTAASRRPAMAFVWFVREPDEAVTPPTA